jgi:hypothetical protein
VNSFHAPSRALARDLAVPARAGRPPHAPLQRGPRRARLAGVGRRALLAASCALVLGAPAASAQEAYVPGEAAAGGAQPAAPAAAAPATAAGRVDVRALQRRLGVTVDGVLGPETRRALKRFQRRHGLAPDGVPGPATLAKLGLAAGAGASSARPSAATPARVRRLRATLERIARCESGGDPTAVSPDGRYRGKYQFSRATWRAVGGKGDPATAPEAEQDLRAAILYERQGPSAWPVCGRR